MPDPRIEKLIGEVIAIRQAIKTVAIMLAHATDGHETMSIMHGMTSTALANTPMQLGDLNEVAVRYHGEVMIDQIFDDGGVFDSH